MGLPAEQVATVDIAVLIEIGEGGIAAIVELIDEDNLRVQIVVFEELHRPKLIECSSNLNISAGLAYVFAAAAWAEIGRLTEDAAWTFLMLDVTF